jgi:polyisoprenoid-binding protein YceI
MSNDTIQSAGTSGGLATGTWVLDPTRSSVEFRVRSIYGLVSVKGGFSRCRGSLDLSAHPAIELAIEAGSLDTGNPKRDEHLRSGDFFDAAAHPRVSFEADAATLDGTTLRAPGTLRAAGGQARLDIVATVRPVDDEFELEAKARVDQRELGMTWSPLGMVRPPARLLVRGRLIRG